MIVVTRAAAGANAGASSGVHQHRTGTAVAHMQGPVVHPVAYPEEAGRSGWR